MKKLLLVSLVTISSALCFAGPVDHCQEKMDTTYASGEIKSWICPDCLKENHGLDEICSHCGWPVWSIDYEAYQALYH